MTRSSCVDRAIIADATLCRMYMHHRQNPVSNYSVSHNLRYQSTYHVMRVKAINLEVRVSHF